MKYLLPIPLSAADILKLPGALNIEPFREVLAAAIKGGPLCEFTNHAAQIWGCRFKTFLEIQVLRFYHAPT